MAKKTAAPAVTTTTLSFGCLGGVCVASNPYPLHLGPPGTHVYISALNTDVEIRFKAASPFLSGKKYFPVAQGQTIGPEIVAPSQNNTKFKFTLKCLAGCPTPASPPEMIVP